MKKTQLLKGILEGLILRIIKDEETYGYAICEKLDSGGLRGVGEGTVYPILTRLEKQRLITSVRRDSPFGPKRKYYSLTKEGSIYLDDFTEQWGVISETVERMIKND